MVADPTGFEKFTKDSRRALGFAREEAIRFNHNYIGTEHLLLGLIHEAEGVVARILSNLGVELNKIRSAVEFIVGRGERPSVGEVGLTPRAKKVLELAVDEARRMNHRDVDTTHLLIGIMREGEGVAAGVLESFHVTLEKIRVETVRVLWVSSASETGEKPVSDKEIAGLLELFDKIDQTLRALEEARKLILRIQSTWAPQRPQSKEPSAQA